VNRRALGILAAFVIQAGLLGWMVADRALLLARGTEIRLPVRPVDPRDLLRGEYVTLDYDLATLKASDLARLDPVAAGEPVYVALERAGETWRATAATARPPGEGLYLKGRVASARGEGTGRTLRVAYNLEKFFMPEGRAIEVERLRNARRIEVDVAVAAGGRATLKRLVIDGALRYEDPLF
jgi:uncharacterized membrane-anchored protein